MSGLGAFGLVAAALVGCVAQDHDVLDSAPATHTLGELAEGGQAPAAPARSVLTLEGPRPRNLLILSVDTLRRDKVGRYSGGGLTPFLDGLLDQSVALDDFRSCSNWTYASMICAQTGRSMVDHGFEPAGRRPDGAVEEAGSVVPEDLEVLPVWLAQAGYATSLVSTTRFLSSSSVTGNGIGREVLAPDAVGEEVTALGIEAAELLIGGAAPWSLHVHYRDPHSPYHAPTRWLQGTEDLPAIAYDLRTRRGLLDLEEDWSSLGAEDQALVITWLNALYDAEVRYFDDELGRLWASLDALGALDDTLVAFFSDHGEQFFEHGDFQHYNDLFDEESAAVGALWARSLVPVAFSGLTGHADLLPAVFEILDLPPPEGVTGLAPGLAPADRHRATFFGPQGVARGPMNTVELDGMRLYYRWSGELSLYDRVLDPGEQEDLYGQQPARRLTSLLVDEVARSQAYVTWAEPTGLPGG